MKLEKNRKTRPFAKKLLRIADKFMGKPFPSMARVREISNYSCGPATLEMLLSFVKCRFSQRAIIKSIRVQSKIRVYGIDINDMARATRIAGKGKLAFWRKRDSRVRDIALAIDKYKFPVGIEWRGDFYENDDEDLGHYGVVTKVNKERGYLRIADPYFNSAFKYNDLDRKYDTSEFVKKWWDTNFVKGRNLKDKKMMFVITPEGESWPKKLGMKRV